MQNPQAGLALFVSHTSYLKGTRALPDAHLQERLVMRIALDSDIEKK
jgi:hypothetical protein